MILCTYKEKRGYTVQKNTCEQSEKKKIKVLGFIFEHGRAQIPILIFSVPFMLLSTVAGFLIPQLIRITVDGVIGADEQALPAWAKAALGWVLDSGADVGWMLLVMALFIGALAALGGVFNYVSRMSVAVGTEGFCRALRQKLFAHTQYLPFGWYAQNQTGDVIQRCTSDLEVLRSFVANQLLEVVRTFIQIGVALGLMFSMSVSLSLVSVAFMPVIVLYSLIFYGIVGKKFLAADEAEGELTALVQENLTGVRVVRAFGRERFELKRFDKKNNHFAGLWMKLGRILSAYWAVSDVVMGIQVILVVTLGAVFAVNGDITLGEYLVFVTYNANLVWPIRTLGRILSEMSKAGVSIGRIQEILDAPIEKAEPGALKPDMHCDIHFENVSFAYGDTKVLKNLNFTIPKGTTLGVLGATGSGKSSLTYLLNRLYELNEGGGSIRFGQVDIRKIDRHYLRRNVGTVLQEPFLFSKTIEQNIAITCEGKAQDAAQKKDVHSRVRDAAKKAAVDDAVMGFAQGYDTVVGERGVTLSGGQKQRVAIARTLMLNAPVMVFDDAMSAVDLETDAKIRRALHEEGQKATVVLISHRINTLMRADKILVLDKGCMVDIGTHKELIARPGPYRRIYEMQSEAAAEVGVPCVI